MSERLRVLSFSVLSMAATAFLLSAVVGCLLYRAGVEARLADLSERARTAAGLVEELGPITGVARAAAAPGPRGSAGLSLLELGDRGGWLLPPEGDPETLRHAARASAAAGRPLRIQDPVTGERMVAAWPVGGRALLVVADAERSELLAPLRRALLLAGLAAAGLASAAWLLVALPSARALLRLGEAQRRAEHAAQGKRDVMARMGQALRSSLPGIARSAESLASDEPGVLDPSSVRSIQQRAWRLLAIADEVLELERIESGAAEMEEHEVSPVAILRSLVAELEPRVRERDLGLAVQFHGRIPTRIRVDGWRLRRVLRNLVLRAIDATGSGGVRVVLRLATDAPPEHPALLFDVIGSGPGMLEREALVPVGRRAADRAAETQLGVALSRQLAPLLGGSLRVQTQPGGIVLSLRLETGPLDGVEMQDASELREVGAGREWPGTTRREPLHGIRILVAEEDEQARARLALLLAGTGAQLTSVDTPEVAMEDAWAAQEAGEPFHLVLIRVEDADPRAADAAVLCLRARGYTGPVLAMEGLAQGAERVSRLRAGFTDVLARPVIRNLLIEMALRYWDKPAEPPEA